MTMHGAKGLDATAVFIPGLEDELLPGPKRAPYPGLVLEAARLLYVSITRAKVACIISRAKSRFAYGSRRRAVPSRFLSSTGGPFAERTEPLTQDEAKRIAGEMSDR